jgi:hypothetical protein
VQVGEAERITGTLIPATGSNAAGASYQVTDQPGRGHFIYELELVQQDSETLRQGKVEVEIQEGQVSEHQLHLPLLQRR